MIKTFNFDIKNIYTHGLQAKAVYTHGIKVWPAEQKSGWVPKNWGEYYPKQGNQIWYDYTRRRIYYNYPNETNLELKNGSWNSASMGMISGGQDVWYWNGESYYSFASNQYRFNYQTATWEQQSWPGSYPLFGRYVWTKDNFLFYNYTNNSMWLLNNRFQNHKWAYEPTFGEQIWNDGEGHTYYSYSNYQYEYVNEYNFKWKNWQREINGGLYNFEPAGECIWNDYEGHTYYSYGTEQYELIDGVWKEKDWGPNYPEYGGHVWKDFNGHIYYSYFDTQLELIP